MTKPIRPEEVVPAREAQIPDAVFEAFNEMIAANYRSGYSCFRKDDVCALIASKMECTVSHVYEQHWLDVEDVYRKAGWRVVYDAPAYNESYPATFEFHKKKDD